MFLATSAEQSLIISLLNLTQALLDNVFFYTGSFSNLQLDFIR